MLSKVTTHRFYIPISPLENCNTGKLFEQIAITFLKRSGYEILEQNWRNKYGEIDCIALSANQATIVIVEVKARSKDGKFSVRAAVDYRKRGQVYEMAKLYRLKSKEEVLNKSFRFDVIRITFQYINNNFLGTLEHIENAFHHGFTLSIKNKKSIFRNRNSKYKKSL